MDSFSDLKIGQSFHNEIETNYVRTITAAAINDKQAFIRIVAISGVLIASVTLFLQWLI